jgi:hypothetical protein
VSQHRAALPRPPTPSYCPLGPALSCPTCHSLPPHRARPLPPLFTRVCRTRVMCAARRCLSGLELPRQCHAGSCGATPRPLPLRSSPTSTWHRAGTPLPAFFPLPRAERIQKCRPPSRSPLPLCSLSPKLKHVAASPSSRDSVHRPRTPKSQIPSPIFLPSNVIVVVPPPLGETLPIHCHFLSWGRPHLPHPPLQLPKLAGVTADPPSDEDAAALPHRRLTSSRSPASTLLARCICRVVVVLEPKTLSSASRHRAARPWPSRPCVAGRQATHCSHRPVSVRHYAVNFNLFSIVFNSRNCFKLPKFVKTCMNVQKLQNKFCWTPLEPLYTVGLTKLTFM